MDNTLGTVLVILVVLSLIVSVVSILMRPPMDEKESHRHPARDRHNTRHRDTDQQYD